MKLLRYFFEWKTEVIRSKKKSKFSTNNKTDIQHDNWIQKSQLTFLSPFTISSKVVPYVNI